MNGKWLVVVVLICWTGLGCSSKNPVPGGILPMEKMKELMWDMAQADQYAAFYVAKDSANIDQKAETMRLYEEVFRLHDVTREEFSKSYRYYLDHPSLNQLLFDSVLALGNRARTELYDIRSTNPGAGPQRPGVPPPGVGGRPGVTGPIVGGRPGMPGPIVGGRPGVPGPIVGGRPGALPVRPAFGAGRRDSLRRRIQVNPDTTRGKP